MRRELQPRFDSPLPGWTSHADPFAMASGYVPADGVSRGRVGTPDILSMLALEEALEVWDGVDMAAVRAKSLALTDFFLRRVRAYVPDGRLRALTPAAHARRGSQVSLRVRGRARTRVMAALNAAASSATSAGRTCCASASRRSTPRSPTRSVPPARSGKPYGDTVTDDGGGAE